MAGQLKKLALQEAPKVTKERIAPVRCDLTPDETVARGRVLAQLHTNIEKLEAERQEVLAGFKERLEDLRREVRRRSGDLVAGAETRMLSVLDTFDFGEATVTTARKDSGAILEKREMTPEERQLGLDQLMQGSAAAQA
jgi:hypothetical protein